LEIRASAPAALELELDAVEQHPQPALEALLVGRQIRHALEGATPIAARERREVGELTVGAGGGRRPMTAVATLASLPQRARWLVSDSLVLARRNSSTSARSPRSCST